MATNNLVRVKSGGGWYNPKSIWIKVGGVWTEVRKVWVKNGGIWSPVAPVSGSQTFTANGTFVVPTGVNHMYLTAIGGGGSAS